MSASPSMERREQIAWVIAGALALFLVGRYAVERDEQDASSQRPDPSIAQAQAAVTDLTVRDSTNARVPLAPRGKPAILMVNSRTCSFCRLALKDVAEMQGAALVPQLRIVTLEGAASGAAMLQQLNVRGAYNTGPDGESDQVLLTFRIPGTPVFARTDSVGRIVETVPGYPGPETIRRWLPVMRGQ
jgi:thioredoxin-related protein